MTTDNTIPKQELLIKLLRMTESDNDGEALAALRKANAFMRSAGWDWEKLVNSKIRIIEDPFKNLGMPTGGNTVRQTPAPPPRQPQSAPPPAQPPAAKTTWPLGINPNKFAAFCYCCGVEVLANAGIIFKPYTFNTRATNDWKVACLPCNGSKTSSGAVVMTYAASRQRQTTNKGKPKPFVSDLS
jgi:hypothetical protein